MGLSPDPRRRSRQLQNLRRGGAPPATPGNQRAKSHGGYAAVAKDRLNAKTREVFEAVSADAPLRDVDGGLPRHDTVAVAMLAQALCRLEDVGAYLTLHGLIDDHGEPRAAVDIERRLRVEIADALDSLGMTPRARARLGLDLARTVEFDLARAMSDLPDVIDADGEEVA
jgi:hypothetical protein